MKSSENPFRLNTTSRNLNEFIYYGLFCLFFLLLITLISIVFLSFVAENIYKSCSAVTLIRRELKKGNDVRLSGFGKFSVIEIADKRIGNPVTGKPFEIHAHRRAEFTPGKNLKNSLNNLNTAGKEHSGTA